MPEYTSGIGYLNLKIVEKETQGAFEVIGPERVTYGTSNSFYTVGGSGSGGVTFSIQEEIGTGEADIDPKTGKLTPEKVGTVYVRATKEGDERYQTVESDPVPVTILPAPLTIQVKDKTARIGDAIPILTAADYTVTGLVGSDTLAQAPSLTYVSTPDMSKTGAVAIQASGAAIPNGNYDPNITYLPGVLTIQEIPTYTVTVPTAENGTITADKATAQEGSPSPSARQRGMYCSHSPRPALLRRRAQCRSRRRGKGFTPLPCPPGTSPSPEPLPWKRRKRNPGHPSPLPMCRRPCGTMTACTTSTPTA